MGAVDISGTRTSIAQVAAEEFGFDLADVHVQMGDTKSVGFTNVSAGSRIRLSIAGADDDHCGQVPHGRPPLVTLLRGEGHASVLELPLAVTK